jgi:uncharacterized protein YxeA
MKKIFIIVFLFIVLIGIIGYAAKLENEYLSAPPNAQQTMSNDWVSQKSQDSMQMDQQILVFGLLLGAGLVGLLIVRRK